MLIFLLILILVTLIWAIMLLYTIASNQVKQASLDRLIHADLKKHLHLATGAIDK